MNMPDGVIVTVSWKIKPEFADAFAEFLGGMFPVTRQRKGFRNIRLLRSDVDPTEFILIQEWDKTQDHRDYAQFRTEIGDNEKLLAMTESYPQLGYWAPNPLAATQI
jgi:heme-degrading monooxygenase HmoA